MEAQTITVAKAGIKATLNSRTTIIASMNPKGYKFDADRSLTANTGIPPALLSRFDLVFLLIDTASRKQDERKTGLLLNGFIRGEGKFGSKTPRKRDKSQLKPLWGIDKLKVGWCIMPSHICAIKSKPPF